MIKMFPGGDPPGYAASMNSSVSARDLAPVDDEALSAAADSAVALLSGVVRRMPRIVTLTALLTLATLDRRGALRLTELAASEGIPQPSMTVLVTSLERAGLVERRGDPGDRRVVHVAITDAGAAFVRVRLDVTAQPLARAMARLSPEEAATIIAAAPVFERLSVLCSRSQTLDDCFVLSGRGCGLCQRLFQVSDSRLRHTQSVLERRGEHVRLLGNSRVPT